MSASLHNLEYFLLIPVYGSKYGLTSMISGITLYLYVLFLIMSFLNETRSSPFLEES